MARQSLWAIIHPERLPSRHLGRAGLTSQSRPIMETSSSWWPIVGLVCWPRPITRGLCTDWPTLASASGHSIGWALPGFLASSALPSSLVSPVLPSFLLSTTGSHISSALPSSPVSSCLYSSLIASALPSSLVSSAIQPCLVLQYHQSFSPA